MENLIKMDDLGGPPLFLETPINLCNSGYPFVTYQRFDQNINWCNSTASLQHQQYKVGPEPSYKWSYNLDMAPSQ